MKRLLLLMLLSVTAFQGFSQTKGISYQAVILNPNPQEIPGVNAQGNILANSTVAIQFTIVNASGTEEYQEQHSTRTDRYGMINLLIGTGTPTGSADFTDIKWIGTTKKLKVAIDFKGGTNFSALSEQNLTYMPQPPTEEVSLEIATNSAAIATERTRAINAEQANATGISTLKTEQTTQNAAIALNIAKVGITPEQASTIGNTTGINTGDQDISGIANNAGAITTLQGEQTTQNTAIALNTAKTGITAQQASDITTNNAKVGITTGQAAAIVANTAKVSYPGDQDISGIAINAGAISTLQDEQTTQNTAIALNTAKKSMSDGTVAGNTPYWDGNQWVNSSNIFNNGVNVGIGTATPNAQSSVEIATALPVIFPSMTQAQVNAITPVEGMVQYNTDAHKLQVYGMITDNAEILNEIYTGTSTDEIGFCYEQSFTPSISGYVLAIEVLIKNTDNYPDRVYFQGNDVNVPDNSSFYWLTTTLTGGNQIPVTAGQTADFFICTGRSQLATNSFYPNGSALRALPGGADDLLFRVHIQPAPGSYGWQNMN